MKGLGGFRNILVHEYLKMDEHKVYEALQTGLTDMEDFISDAIRWIEGIEKKSGPISPGDYVSILAHGRGISSGSFFHLY